MKIELEVDAYTVDTNNRPIMILDGNKQVSLNRKLLSLLGNNINLFAGCAFWHTQKGMQIGELTSDNIRRHTKKLKITVEMNES